MRALAEQLGPRSAEPYWWKTGSRGRIDRARACADPEPDGYTICILNNESMVINPLIFKNQNSDPKTSLSHVTRLFNLQHVFAVNASLNVKTFDEVAALAQSKPKTMNYLTPHPAKVAFMEAFNKKYDIDFVRVPFSGGGDAVNSMMTGTTPVAIFGIGNLIQLIRAGKSSAWRWTATRAHRSLPRIPTFREAGYSMHVWAVVLRASMCRPAHKPIVDKLNQAIVKNRLQGGISEALLFNEAAVLELASFAVDDQTEITMQAGMSCRLQDFIRTVMKAVAPTGAPKPNAPRADAAKNLRLPQRRVSCPLRCG